MKDLYLVFLEIYWQQQELLQLIHLQEHFKKEIQEMEAYFPVICGEWCLFNSLACGWFPEV